MRCIASGMGGGVIAAAARFRSRLVGVLRGLGTYVLFNLEVFRAIFSPPFETRMVIHQMYEVGVRSLPICLLTSFFVGMVLALQTGYASIAVLNEPVNVGTVVTFSLLKELGPMLTAVVLVGRIGAAITAELGSMRVTEQIDAMYTLGTDPVKYLIVPRLLALSLMLPLLVVFTNIIGVLGGMLISAQKPMYTPYTIYWEDSFQYLGVDDFFHGFIKAGVFGVMIATIACYKGFATQGGAEGVGRATTDSVVTAIAMLLIGDFFISSVLIALRIG